MGQIAIGYSTAAPSQQMIKKTSRKCITRFNAVGTVTLLVHRQTHALKDALGWCETVWDVNCGHNGQQFGVFVGATLCV